MLVLGRKKGQAVLIGNDIKIIVADIRQDGSIRLAIDAPKNVVIMRAELLERGGDDGAQKQSQG